VRTPVVTRQNTCESNKVAKHKRAVAQDILSREVAAPRTLHTDGTNVMRSLPSCVIVGTFCYCWNICGLQLCVIVGTFMDYNYNAILRCRHYIFVLLSDCYAAFFKSKTIT
jgi:hypothetical protein